MEPSSGRSSVAAAAEPCIEAIGTTEKVQDTFAAGAPKPASTPARDAPGPDTTSGPGAAKTRTAHERRNGTGEPGDAAPGGLFRILQRFVEETAGTANGLVEVYADRLRLSVRRTFVQIVLGSAAAVCAIVWLGAGSLSILRGTCGGLAALCGGREWLGDLLGGLLALTLAAGAAAIHLRVQDRRELARLEQKYRRNQT